MVSASFTRVVVCYHDFVPCLAECRWLGDGQLNVSGGCLLCTKLRGASTRTCCARYTFVSPGPVPGSGISGLCGECPVSLQESAQLLSKVAGPFHTAPAWQV